jgi:hypothetical protein
MTLSAVPMTAQDWTVVHATGPDGSDAAPAAGGRRCRDDPLTRQGGLGQERAQVRRVGQDGP